MGVPQDDRRRTSDLKEALESGLQPRLPDSGMLLALVSSDVSGEKGWKRYF